MDIGVGDVLGDDVSQGAVATTPFINVTANHTISTTLTQDTPYAITGESNRERDRIIPGQRLKLIDHTIPNYRNK